MEDCLQQADLDPAMMWDIQSIVGRLIEKANQLLHVGQI